jgi:hypothetical protein
MKAILNSIKTVLALILFYSSSASAFEWSMKDFRDLNIAGYQLFHADCPEPSVGESKSYDEWMRIGETRLENSRFCDAAEAFFRAQLEPGVKMSEARDAWKRQIHAYYEGRDLVYALNESNILIDEYTGPMNLPGKIQDVWREMIIRIHSAITKTNENREMKWVKFLLGLHDDQNAQNPKFMRLSIREYKKQFNVGEEDEELNEVLADTRNRWSTYLESIADERRKSGAYVGALTYYAQASKGGPSLSNFKRVIEKMAHTHLEFADAIESGQIETTQLGMWLKLPQPYTDEMNVNRTQIAEQTRRAGESLRQKVAELGN